MGQCWGLVGWGGGSLEIRLDERADKEAKLRFMLYNVEHHAPPLVLSMLHWVGVQVIELFLLRSAIRADNRNGKIGSLRVLESINFSSKIGIESALIT